MKAVLCALALLFPLRAVGFYAWSGAGSYGDARALLRGFASAYRYPDEGASAGSEASSARLPSSSLPKPMPGSSHTRSFATPAAMAAVESGGRPQFVDDMALDGLAAGIRHSLAYYRRVPADRVYGDWQEMLAGEKDRPDRIDLVTIATPNATHFEITKAFLKAGFHVLCEKPMAMNAAEAREMMAVARRHDRRETLRRAAGRSRHAGHLWLAQSHPPRRAV